MGSVGLAGCRATTSDNRVSGVGGASLGWSGDQSTTPAPAATTASAPPAWLPVAAVAVTLVLWASAFVAIRYLGDDFSPGALSLGRLLVGALCLGVVALPPRTAPAHRGATWSRSW